MPDPSPRRLESWAQLDSSGSLPAPADVSLVSVDLFDTLILRRTSPELILEAVDRELLQQLEIRGIEPSVDPARSRREVFTEAGAEACGRGFDFAASLRDVSSRWIERVAGSERLAPADLAGLADHLETFETSLEARSALVNQAVCDWIEAQRREGLRVVFCSDMYLPGERIDQILDALGLRDLFSDGYVSADHGVLKKTGRLFEHLLATEGVEPHAVLHLGDSWESDGVRAVEAGCHAWVVQDRAEATRRRRVERDAERLRTIPEWIGPMASEWAARDQNRREQGFRNPWTLERIGSELLGPAISTFLHGVIESCRRDEVRTLYFLAREGWTLKRVYDTLVDDLWPADRPRPRVVYLGVSRITALRAGSPRIGFRQLEAARGNHRHLTLRRLLAPFDVPETLMKELGHRQRIDDLDARLPAAVTNWPPLQRLLDDPDLTSFLEASHARHRDVLRRYLESVGFFRGGTVALVDVGWSGQIQDHLVQAFQHEAGFPNVLGLYLGVRGQAHERATTVSRYRGLLADADRPGWQSQAAFLFVQAIESMLRAPHGTVVGYDDPSTGRVVPRVRSETSAARHAERIEEQTTAPIQAGILRHAARYALVVRLAGTCFEDARPWARTCLDRLFRYPTPDEARALTSLINVCDLGMDEVVPLGVAPPGASGIAARLRRLFQLRRDLAESFWKPGFWTLRVGTRLRHPALVWHAVRAATPRGLAVKVRRDGASLPPGTLAGPSDDPRLDEPSIASFAADEAARARWDELIRERASAAKGWDESMVRSIGPWDLVVTSVSRWLTNRLSRLVGKSALASDGFSTGLWLRRHLGETLRRWVERHRARRAGRRV